jgi:LysM repeat protein
MLTIFLSLILSASTELRKSSVNASADVTELSENLISELGVTESINCEKTITDASLTCQDYYNNITDAQKPEDFLNVYLVEDSEFVFGTQNRSEQTISATTDKNQLMTYIVIKGDTLGKIAEKFGVSVDTIKVANRLTKNVLTPGKELVILPISGVYYIVKKGDTLGRIASQYKISVSSILEYNGINEKYIKVGDKIILPGAKAIAEMSNSSTATPVTNTGSSLSGYFIYPTTG